MPIPDYQTLMLPLLKYAAAGNVLSVREAYDAMSRDFGLTEGERHELLPSGRQPVINNRVGWAKTYMLKAGLLEKVRRGQFSITQRGRDVLSRNPERIDVVFLRQFPEFLDFQSHGASAGNDASIIGPEEENATSTTPEEGLERAYQEMRRGLAEELLRTVKESTAGFFEQLVIDLLVAMGYGGSRKEASTVGRSGDGGIDGIIKEDRLGLDVVYVQAKRWDTTTVGRPEIQKFAGALQGRRAKKGIFITTSSFSKDAHEYVGFIDSKIILIDGKRLT
jgi:restriction system protein